jgi:site-specific DNA-methyltransferase (adenine-specific)
LDLSTNLSKGIDTREELAKIAGVSQGTINKVEHIENQAVPEIKEQIRAGKISINEAEQASRLEPDKQKAVADRIAAGQAKSVKAAVNQEKTEAAKQAALNSGDKKPAGGVLYEGDIFDEISKVADRSVDLLFVDPPYMLLKEQWDQYASIEQFIAFSKKWLDLVMPKVKQTGRIYICFSQYYQYDFYRLLSENNFYGFNFGQTIIWNYRNNNQPSDRKMYRFAYEPIFYLYGKEAGPLNFTPETYGETQFNVWTIATPQSNFSEGKFHPAQKPLELLERIIITGSREGDMVLDPFAGSGTTGIVARKQMRKYTLIEKDPEYCKIARGRLNGVA